MAQLILSSSLIIYIWGRVSQSPGWFPTFQVARATLDPGPPMPSPLSPTSQPQLPSAGLWSGFMCLSIFWFWDKVSLAGLEPTMVAAADLNLVAFFLPRLSQYRVCTVNPVPGSFWLSWVGVPLTQTGILLLLSGSVFVNIVDLLDNFVKIFCVFADSLLLAAEWNAWDFCLKLWICFAALVSVTPLCSVHVEAPMLGLSHIPDGSTSLVKWPVTYFTLLLRSLMATCLWLCLLCTLKCVRGWGCGSAAHSLHRMCRVCKETLKASDFPSFSCWSIYFLFVRRLVMIFLTASRAYGHQFTK